MKLCIYSQKVILFATDRYIIFAVCAFSGLLLHYCCFLQVNILFASAIEWIAIHQKSFTSTC